MKRFTVFLCSFLLTVFVLCGFLAVTANALTLGNTDGVLYSDFDTYFDPLGLVLDTITVGQYEIDLLSQVYEGELDNQLLYAYSYQLQFNTAPVEAANLYLAIDFDASFFNVPGPLGPAAWGESVAGDTWPFLAPPANRPTGVSFRDSDGWLVWDLPDTFTGNLRTTPMIVFSESGPVKTRAGLFNNENLLDGGFNSIGASVPEPATMLLLGAGLLGLAGIGRKRFLNKKKA